MRSKAAARLQQKKDAKWEGIIKPVFDIMGLLPQDWTLESPSVEILKSLFTF